MTALEIDIHNAASSLGYYIERRTHATVDPNRGQMAERAARAVKLRLPLLLVGCTCHKFDCGHDAILKVGKMDGLTDELIQALDAFVDAKISQARTPAHMRRSVMSLSEHPAALLKKKLHAFITEHGKEKKRAAQRKSE
jgi:hypothetical protein